MYIQINYYVTVTNPKHCSHTSFFFLSMVTTPFRQKSLICDMKKYGSTTHMQIGYYITVTYVLYWAAIFVFSHLCPQKMHHLP